MTAISVIVPIYNVEKYLARCLISLQEQSFADFEVICVNDGSTDRSGEICRDFAKKDARIKIVEQSNAGLSVARNAGLAAAYGKYVCFLDSDDYLHHQALELNYFLAEKHQADIVTFGLAENYGEGRLPETDLENIDRLKMLVTDQPLKYLRGSTKFKISISSCTKFYRREVVAALPFQAGITFFEDVPHTLCLFKDDLKTVIVDVALYFYTVSNSSLTRRKFSLSMLDNYRRGLLFICDYYADEPKKLNFILTKIFWKHLRKQLKLIQSLHRKEQLPFWDAFAAELSELDEKHAIKFCPGNWRNYFTYKKLIRRRRLSRVQQLEC